MYEAYPVTPFQVKIPTFKMRWQTATPILLGRHNYEDRSYSENASNGFYHRDNQRIPSSVRFAALFDNRSGFLPYLG